MRTNLHGLVFGLVESNEGGVIVKFAVVGLLLGVSGRKERQVRWH
jgi:hypothetical protein